MIWRMKLVPDRQTKKWTVSQTKTQWWIAWTRIRLVDKQSETPEKLRKFRNKGSSLAPKQEQVKVDREALAKESYNPINHKMQSAYEINNGQNFMYQTPTSTLTDVNEAKSIPSSQKNVYNSRKITTNYNKDSSKFDLINHR